MRHLPALFLLILIAIAVPAQAQAQANPADSIFSAYVAAVLSDNWTAAESLWLPAEVELANRLEIRFTGLPLKVDCTSPLQEHRAVIANGTIQYSVSDSLVSDSLVAKIVEIRSGAVAVRHTYLLVPTETGWRLTSPIYHATRDWPEYRTRFFRVRCPDSSLRNEYALEALDAAVDSLGTIFHFHDEHWIRLTAHRIDYYLADRTAVRALTGHDAHGLTYLPLDAIVTSHLPHPHEIVHALMNFRLGQLPMYTLPALQEGVAVAYGGRWGKAPHVSLQMGAFVLDADLMTVKDILTYDGFQADASDLSYAVGGLFTRCLISSMGFPNFTVLYRRLSGPQQYVRGIRAEDVRQAVEESTGQPWERVVPACLVREVELFTHRGLDPCLEIPDASLLWQEKADGLQVRVLENEVRYYVELAGEKAGGQTGVALSDPDFGDTAYRSRLFSEQFPDAQYDRQVLGIVCDSLEAGLYDYRRDLLLAKFASGFSTGESIWDPAARLIRFQIDKAMLPDTLAPGRLRLIR